MDSNTGGLPGNRNDINQGSSYITNSRQEALNNTLFYTTKWTSKNIQFALMSVPVDTETGLDVHYTSDQLFYIEQGEALVIMGPCYNCLGIPSHAPEGYTIIVPAGMWHNILNVGSTDLKMYSIFAPSLHSHNTVFRTTQEWFDYYEND